MWLGRLEEGGESVRSIVRNYASAPFVGEEFHLVVNKATDVPFKSLAKHGVSDSNIFSAIASAYAALTSGQQDRLYVYPGSHVWAAAITWAKSNTFMIGSSPASKAAYTRARFSHAGYAMSPFATVTGAENYFANVRWMHGASTGAAADTTCLTVSGAGNVFEYCNFAGPNDATQAASNNYIGVLVSGGTSNYFKDCIFGTHNAIDRNGTSSMLKLAGAGGLNVFENCIFRSHGGQNSFFINWAHTEMSGPDAIFLNCHFVNAIAAAETVMDYAITDSSHANNHLYFDSNCTFSGCSEIIAAASESKVYIGGAVDGAVVGDRLNLLMAVNPNVS